MALLRPQAQPTDAAILRRLFGRQAVPLVLVLGIAALFWTRWSDVDLAGAFRSVSNLAPERWLAAIAATAASYWAVARYDRVIHRVLATGTPGDEAARAGVTAMALAQATGFGLFTATLVRWRMLPGASLWTPGRLSSFAAAGFLAGLAVVAVLAALAAGMPLSGSGGVALLVLAAAGLWLAITIWPPRGLFGLSLPRSARK